MCVRFPVASASAVAFFTAAARAELVTHSLTFVEVISGTNTPVPSPNGLLEPGESARLVLSISFTPLVGSTVAYPPPPPPGVGTCAGLYKIFIDLANTPTTPGTWSMRAHAPGWGAGGNLGQSVANGAYLNDIGAGQLVLPGQTANPANPVDSIWRGVWTPASYSPRTVTWNVGQGEPGIEASAIMIQFAVEPGGAPQYTTLIVPGEYGTVAIPIVPAPATAPVLILAAAGFAPRRTRRLVPACP